MGWDGVGWLAREIAVRYPSPHIWKALSTQGPPDSGVGMGLGWELVGKIQKVFYKDLGTSTWVGEAKNGKGQKWGWRRMYC
jgi:hypothetical protein